MFFRIIVVCFFALIGNLVSAQQTPENSSTVIILKGNATIYSLDQDFNNQVAEKKVVFHGAGGDLKKSSGQKKLLLVSGKKSTHGVLGFKAQVAIAEKKKQQEVVKKIKKTVEDFEAKKKELNFQELTLFPSGQEFVASVHVNKDYVAPVFGHHYFSKLSAVDDQCVIKSALDFLHKQNFGFYNSSCLDYCFSEVFSVRPPPVLG